MSIARLTLALFISIGLTLAPVQAARIMLQPTKASSTTTIVQSAPSSGHHCACCKFSPLCGVMAKCAINCSQYIPLIPSLSAFAVVGHAVFAAFSPPSREGLGRRPPIPPPRA